MNGNSDFKTDLYEINNVTNDQENPSVEAQV